MASRPCDQCGQAFEPRRRDHRFCSAECRLQAFLARRDAQRQEWHAQVRMRLREALELLEETTQ